MTTHGHTSNGVLSPTYKTWTRMHQRCRFTYHPTYKWYGGRGIKVCDHWKLFENFLADMGERPEGKSLDRINNDGNYEPSNCRWATRDEQFSNRSDNRFVLLNGIKLIQKQAIKAMGLPRWKIEYWLKKHPNSDLSQIKMTNEHKCLKSNSKPPICIVCGRYMKWSLS